MDKAVTQKLQKMQAKLDRCVKEKEILDDVSINLPRLINQFVIGCRNNLSFDDITALMLSFASWLATFFSVIS